jgi:hypothetical protein
VQEVLACTEESSTEECQFYVSIILYSPYSMRTWQLEVLHLPASNPACMSACLCRTFNGTDPHPHNGTFNGTLDADR